MSCFPGPSWSPRRHPPRWSRDPGKAGSPPGGCGDGVKAGRVKTTDRPRGNMPKRIRQPYINTYMYGLRNKQNKNVEHATPWNFCVHIPLQTIVLFKMIAKSSFWSIRFKGYSPLDTWSFICSILIINLEKGCWTKHTGLLKVTKLNALVLLILDLHMHTPLISYRSWWAFLYLPFS